ncbi:hypothetical protein TNCV_2267491 [Trichonephila clavipes]|nr:hypothetical protein TNCV_2267491 [Trichonephila clavipes]
MIPAKSRRDMLLFLSKRESISGESPISFPEDSYMPYLGFEPEPSRLQFESHNPHTGWGRKNTIYTPKSYLSRIDGLEGACPPRKSEVAGSIPVSWKR